MSFTIPSEVFTPYFDVVDELIRNNYTSESITLYFTEMITSVNDTSHIPNLAGGPPTNYNPDGQLDNFNKQAGGTTYSQVESTTTIRVRWYPDPKVWNKILNVVIPEVKVLIIGNISDMASLIKANQIMQPFCGQQQKFVLAAQPQTWGFGDRYFVAQLKEA